MLRNHRLTIIALIIFILPLHAFSAPDTHRPYTLDRSEVIDFHAEANGKDYEIYIKLPENYGKSADQKFPLVVLTDGYYAFPLLSSINWRMSERNQVYQQSIIVGISYSKGDDINKSRSRDYTPSFSPNEKFNTKAAQAESGQAKLFIQFIAQELLPYVVSHYAVDPAKKIYAGHSYGGLLGTYILFTQPSLFDYYLIGSPSLWYDNKVMFSLEADYAKNHTDLKAKVFMATGAEEDDPEHGMVKNMLALDKQLQARHYPQLALTTRTIPDEGHLSGYPAFITQGLLWALPLKTH
jgi:predicted alpha/beta superfamily hydrolase